MQIHVLAFQQSLSKKNSIFLIKFINNKLKMKFIFMKKIIIYFKYF